VTSNGEQQRRPPDRSEAPPQPTLGSWDRDVSSQRILCDSGGPSNKAERPMPGIPKVLQTHINTAFPNDVCLIATVLPSGYAQVTPRGSTQVFDDGHFSLWERGKGSTTENLTDGTKVTIYFRKPQLRADGILPKGGIARFYGSARLYKSGPIYEQVWTRLIQPEKDRDPDKKGFAVLVEVERAEELDGTPLAMD
jgi:pyridoxamine 5'-phosphate oxidase-like protein